MRFRNAPDAPFTAGFREQAALLVRATRALRPTLSGRPDPAVLGAEVRDLERRGAAVREEGQRLLTRTFITSMPRSQILDLTLALQRALADTADVAHLIAAYGRSLVPDGADEEAALLVQAAERIELAVGAMASARKVRERTREVCEIDQRADRRAREAIAHLFAQSEPLALLAGLDIQKALRGVTRSADAVAQVLDRMAAPSPHEQ